MCWRGNEVEQARKGRMLQHCLEHPTPENSRQVGGLQQVRICYMCKTMVLHWTAPRVPGLSWCDHPEGQAQPLSSWYIIPVLSWPVGWFVILGVNKLYFPKGWIVIIISDKAPSKSSVLGSMKEFSLLYPHDNEMGDMTHAFIIFQSECDRPCPVWCSTEPAGSLWAHCGEQHLLPPSTGCFWWGSCWEVETSCQIEVFLPLSSPWGLCWC